jgi:hypothetical protein
VCVFLSSSLLQLFTDWSTEFWGKIATFWGEVLKKTVFE